MIIDTYITPKASTRNFARRNKTALVPRIQKSKWILHYYILNKLKIVENTPSLPQWTNINMKRPWLRLWCPSEIHMPFLGSPGPGPLHRLNPPLIGNAYSRGLYQETRTNCIPYWHWIRYVHICYLHKIVSNTHFFLPNTDDLKIM